jgi:hypothetical protein
VVAQHDPQGLHAVARTARTLGQVAAFQSSKAALAIGTKHTAGTLVGGQLVPFLIFVNLMLLLNWLLFAVVGIHRAATVRRSPTP